MSAPIPLRPLPLGMPFLVNPIQPNTPTPLAQNVSSIESIITTGSNMSPSNHSSISSAYPLSATTAASSPISNFHLGGVGFGGAGIIANQAVNPHSTTRILVLSDFNKELKTRDIQHVFSDWEDDRGGFKIKWVDDTSCLIVFADPGVAKRAFVTVLCNPPNSLTTLLPDGSTKLARLRAYNGPDVTHILTSVQNRPRARSNASQSLHSRASSIASNSNVGALGRRPSMGTVGPRNRSSISAGSGMSMRSQQPINPIGSNPSVMPSIQTQDLLDNMNNYSHSNGTPITNPNAPQLSRPSTANSEIGEQGTPSNLNGYPGGPIIRSRIDDAGKRFIAAGLSKPSSAISHMSISELDESAHSASYSLANLTIEEEAPTPTASSH
ncbi:hypothetical protein O181_074888 [Austropuccinia psidii MF-1]|uniref:Uncharacterized protein n=1 Tax=Austropuccinia psidii MF-1 TaxID=1389203 RepID=A0A9Q3F7S9_9BASI|nr:hypothetical protein [Austropuccinia psidii MF-1]